MGCGCGQKKATALAAARAARPPNGGSRASASAAAAKVVAGSPASATAGVMVRYLATAAARIVGARTGRTYDFTGAAPLYIVAAADAPALLASPHFRRG